MGIVELIKLLTQYGLLEVAMVLCLLSSPSIIILIGLIFAMRSIFFNTFLTKKAYVKDRANDEKYMWIPMKSAIDKLNKNIDAHQKAHNETMIKVAEIYATINARQL